MTPPARQCLRNQIFQEITRSLCPQCRQVIDAQVLIHDGAVYLRKHCPDHGWHEALVSSDASWYLNSLKYNGPGVIPCDFATVVEHGCPFDCGLCLEHQQHTCIGLVEITTRCDLICPTCFADAGTGYDLSVAQVEAILDRLLQTEGQPEVVQISGGEPTLHPQVLDVLSAARARHIRYLMLNTNGLRLAEDPDFTHQLARYRPFIYLQFDSLSAQPYQTLRGRDLRAIKQQALDNLAEAGLYAVLVPTIVQGINDGELGDILRFGLEHPAVLGVSYQPVTFAGRCLSQQDPLNRITVPDVLHALEAQTEGLFRVSDFRPVPCPYPTCSACTYAVVHDGIVIPIPRIVDVDDYQRLVTNRAVLMPDLSDELQPAIEALRGLAQVLVDDGATNDLTCEVCGINVQLPIKPEQLREHFFMVHVHGFMDEHTFDLRRVRKCCVHQLLPDGRAVPFCAYNCLGYREQVKREQEAFR